MKNLCSPEIAKFRDHQADRMYGTKDSERALGGAFLVPFRGNGLIHWMRVIASAGKGQEEGWRFDHVSVSLSNRTPTWEEMDYIKRLFFHPEEVCFQLHVAAAEHINQHPYCLHIWRDCEHALRLPPAEMVGIQSPVPA